MASEFPGRPNLMKGALAVYESQQTGTEPQLIVFQYNPDQIKRTLARRTPPAEPGNAGAAREDLLRVPGPPVETITLTVEMNATDQMVASQQDQVTAENGLHPALAILEMLLYPPALRTQQLESQLAQGEVQVSSEELPLVLLVWGRSRVVPVQLSSFSVTEEFFDRDLNPVRAKVELGMRVLTYIEFQTDSLGRDAFVTYQQRKETLAGLYEPQGDQSRITTLLPE